MQSLTARLVEFETKTNKLIAKHKALLEKYMKLKEENVSLTETILRQKEIIKKLETQQKINHNNKPLELTKEDPIITKQFINEMMREIDKCLLFLDK